MSNGKRPPLNYESPAEDVEARKAQAQWEREHEAERRQFARESIWMDLTSNWKSWIVAVIIVAIFWLLVGRGGLIWQMAGCAVK